MNKKKLAIVIGRFQPLHYGHVSLIRKAFEVADEVVVLVGSSFMAFAHRNPFTFEMRKQWIQESFVNANVIGIPDYPHSDDDWKNFIIEVIETRYGYDDSDIAIVGHVKDDSSYYLQLFSQWRFIEHHLHSNFHSTDIRDLVYDHKLPYIHNVVPSQVFASLETYQTTDACRLMKNERDYQINYMKDYEHLEFPPIFVTGDAVAICGDHILLITRGSDHGYGQLALPGGYLDKHETIRACISRELVEETSIRVNYELKQVVCFDHPNRSVMARSITHAGLTIVEENDGVLPIILGNDDALEAYWIKLSEIDKLREKLFLDHYHIIKKLLQVKAGLL